MYHSHTGVPEGMLCRNAAVSKDEEAQHPHLTANQVPYEGSCSAQVRDAGPLQLATEPTGTPESIFHDTFSSLPSAEQATVKQEFIISSGLARDESLPTVFTLLASSLQHSDFVHAADASMYRPLKELRLESADISTLPHCEGNVKQDDVKCPLLNKDINVPRTFHHKTFDHHGGVLISKDGIKITIPKGAIKEEDLVTCYVTVSLCGPFAFSSQCQADVVSPYYWIGVSGSYQFQNPIDIEFEHHGACDPSHYQLLCCEDDDKSYTMQPVDCDLDIRVEGDTSFCKFQTDYCCSYCLQHKNKCDINTNRIGAFFLKPLNFESLNSFTVEVWFSFTTKHCLDRNRELYTKKGMVLDEDYSVLFEAPADKSSTSYFQVSYDRNIYGWHLDHSQPSDLIIKTKTVNFYNDYTDSNELFLLEKHSLFPPCFCLHVRNIEQQRTTDLDTNITVTLYNSLEERKPLKVTKFKLFSPVSTTTNDPRCILIENPSLSIGKHSCSANTPDFKDLLPFLEKIIQQWKQNAIRLGIPHNKVVIIDLDHQKSVEDKCFDMFTTWLKMTTSPCWCHFIRALYSIKLNNVAEEAKKHLKLCSSASVAPPDISDTKAGNSTVASSDVNTDNSKNRDLHEFTRYLRDIPDSDLNYFIYCLLPHKKAVEVIKQVKANSSMSKEEKIKKICITFLNEMNPSWAKVHKALKKVENDKCDELAEIVDVTFLTP